MILNFERPYLKERYAMLTIPRTSLIVLCGVAGCGKSTFASNNFKAMEIVSSDRCRAMVSDNEDNMAVSKEAFELFHFIIQKRMEVGRLVVADSTALSHDARKKLLQLARRNSYHIILLGFDIPLETALRRNSMRERKVSEKVIEKQYFAFKRALKYIGREGYDEILILDDQKAPRFEYEILKSGEVSKSREIFENISDFHSLEGPLVLKCKSGARVRIEQEELEDALKALYSNPVDPSWMIYIPPIIPCISAQNIQEQVCQALKYYRNRGVHRMVVEERVMKDTSVIVICRDTTCSKSYFLSEAVGEMYTNLKSLSIDYKRNLDLIDELHEDLVNSGYFTEYNTDFILFEGAVFQDTESFIVPYRLLSHSSSILYKQDSIWQAENIEKLCSCSKLLKTGKKIMIDDKSDIKALIGMITAEGYSEFVIKPVRAFPYYKGEMIQPEILCTAAPYAYGEGCFSLSTSTYDLSQSGLDRFIKNTLSGEYIQYSVGSTALNDRIAALKI